MWRARTGKNTKRDNSEGGFVSSEFREGVWAGGTSCKLSESEWYFKIQD